MKNALQTLDGARGLSPVWTQPRALVQEFVLTGGGRTLATLRWSRAFGSLAEGRMGADTWTFKRVGFWKPAVTIRRPESGDADVGRFTLDWGGGQLELRDGGRYRWDQVTFWKGIWAFFDASGREKVVEFLPQNRMLEMSMMLRVEPGHESCRDLPLLMLLGWYLIVMAAQDDTAAAAVVVLS